MHDPLEDSLEKHGTSELRSYSPSEKTTLAKLAVNLGNSLVVQVTLSVGIIFRVERENVDPYALLD
jgi:hypothetical protein